MSKIIQTELYPVWFKTVTGKYENDTCHHVQLRAWYNYDDEYGIIELCYFNLATFGSTGRHDTYELDHTHGKRVIMDIYPGNVNQTVDRALQIWIDYSAELMANGLEGQSYYNSDGSVYYPIKGADD